jgi:adenylate cyclase
LRETNWTELDMSQLFKSIADWLLTRALEDADLTETVQLLTRRLIDGGIPISRLVVGRTQLHPLIVGYDLRWDSKSGRTNLYTVPHGLLSQEEVRKTPFGSLMARETNHLRADLTKPEDVAKFEIFEQLRDSGVSDYAAWTKAFLSKTNVLGKDARGRMPGMSLSVCTNRHSGFSDSDIAGFERILVPIFLCTRVSTERYLARELLETYLGRNTGNKVLTGQSSRGDGETIECVLFYSDMRGSSVLSQQLEQDEYLATLNRYFDCVAGAVLDHGGEVLKFIGDGILAIFPINKDQRPAEAMCAAALAAAQEAYARAARLEEPPQFGTALHVGKVVYGNVGTATRLDYTATGAAVALTCRCEAITKTLDNSIVSTKEFNALSPSGGVSLGAHEITGFDDPEELFGWPVVNEAN